MVTGIAKVSFYILTEKSTALKGEMPANRAHAVFGDVGGGQWRV